MERHISSSSYLISVPFGGVKIRQYHLLNDIRDVSELIGGPRVSNDIDSDKRHAGVVFEDLDENVRVIHR